MKDIKMANLYIGIRGAKRAGKDTFGSFLSTQLIASTLAGEIRIVRKSFAKNLKDVVAIVFGFDPKFVHSDDFKDFITHVYPLMGSRTFNAKNPLTGRELLQYFGSEICREMDNNCWARAPLVEATRQFEQYDDNKLGICMVTDLRFPNEVVELRKYNSLVIKIERPGYNGDNHVSERALDDFDDDDVVINNSGTKEDLHQEARRVVNIIKERLRGED